MSASLKWIGGVGNVIAQGQSGMYSIQSLSDGQHILQAIDGDARARLPFLGLPFASLDEAKTAAEGVDHA